MISSRVEYELACDELAELARRMERLQRDQKARERTLTIASIRMLIARIQEELAEYEVQISASSSDDVTHPPDDSESPQQ